MQEEDKKIRSLKEREKSKIRFSQIVIVILLVVVSIIAVSIALPQSWRSSMSSKVKHNASFRDIINESAEAGRTFREDLSSVITKIENLRTVGDTVSPDPIEVVIPDTVDQESSRITKYINYDWNISFDIPPSWRYDGARSAFVSSNRHMEVTRIPEFILPEFWSDIGDSTATSTFEDERVLYFKEVDEDVLHATVQANMYTYIFTTTSTTKFTEEEKSIIRSLSIL